MAWLDWRDLLVAAGRLWETVRFAYAEPDGRPPADSDVDYLGYEFTRDGGAVMLYLEQRC